MYPAVLNVQNPIVEKIRIRITKNNEDYLLKPKKIKMMQLCLMKQTMNLDQMLL